VALDAPVTAEELAEYWPGGAENKLTGRGAWIYCWARYNAFLERTKGTGGDVDPEAIEAAALKAFRDEPQVVELVRPLPDGSPFLAVYPKSLAALSLLDAIEEEIRWLVERIEWLRARWEQDAPEKTGEFLRVLILMELYAVWVCTTEGPGVPFNPAGTWPDVPLDLQHLEPLDILNVIRGHHAVNKGRIALIASSLRKRDGGDRQGSWATLTMRAGGALGVPADRLTVTRSLASWFVEVALKWDDQAEQHDRAERKHRTPDPMAEAIG
jgi:hypothetical protein